MKVLARCRSGLIAWVSAGVLVGCTAPLVPPEPSAVDAASASGRTADAPPLLPLASDIAVPPGEGAHSAVASVRYDLSVMNEDLLPDDGVPGDRPAPQEVERGGASWYGIQFHQRRTASGERFDMGAMTAAHKTLPFGSHVCVRSLVNGREVMVRINDRGPYTAGRVIDLSRAAADAIGLLGLGIKQVALSRLSKGQKCGDVLNEADDVDLAETVVPSPVVLRTPVRKATRSARRPAASPRR